MHNRPVNSHKSYHAHVYFDAASEIKARSLCIAAWQSHHIALGRFHRRPVGPHPHWSCQLSFNAAAFDLFIPWLDNERGDLNILVHPLTGDQLSEHTTHATWLGNPVALKLDVFT